MTDTNTPSVDGAEGQASGASDDLLNNQPGDGGEPTSGGENPTGKQQAGDEQAEGGDDQNGTPGEYGDFAVPEGFEIDQELLAQANLMFKELGLSQEQAQKFVDFETQRVQSQVDQFQQQVEAWKTSAKTDEEFGNDKLNQSVAISNKVLEGYFEKAFVEELKSIGFLNHPELIRGLTRIGNKYLTEDNPGSGSPSRPEKSRVERLYGKQE